KMYFLIKSASNLFKTLTDIFFPRLCFKCMKKIPSGILCFECRNKIIFLNTCLCRLCCQEKVQKNLQICRSCSKKALPYDRLISAVYYREPISELIHQFKYNNHSFLCEFFSQILINHLKKSGWSSSGFDLITAVPMHRDKLKYRGYNPPELLAKSLSNYFKIPFYNDIIAAVSCRPSQTKLNPEERLANVSKAFKVTRPLQNNKIILVDDIFTTGATVLACCQKMKEEGARHITIVTAAKT
ncbi:MAG: ComF family protein, partial [Candidatus Omnitrophica bacterium]|nr:ComF family protein [Candidatus Omnitrophota bacterium]